MYETWNGAVLGFSRNIHQYFGGSTLAMSLFWFIVCFGPFLVFAADKWCFFFLFVPLSIVNRVAVAWKCRQNIAGDVILHPLQMIGFTAIVLYNLFGRIKRETEWKGRKIRL
jgi:chlorobactene glucosyltransferase